VPGALDRRAVAHDLVVVARRDLAVVEGGAVAVVMNMAGLMRRSLSRLMRMGVLWLGGVLLYSVGHDGAQSAIAP
jgi:hypothetical protein